MVGLLHAAKTCRFSGSIFDPFLVNSQSKICLFYGTFSISMAVLDPFLDVFLTVHLSMIFDVHRFNSARSRTSCCRVLRFTGYTSLAAALEASPLRAVASFVSPL
jgi:hypothetical protein